MVFMGFTSAVESVFSYHYGSGNIEMRKKVYRLSMIWNLVLGAAVMILFFFLRKPAVGIFFTPGTEFYDIAQYGYLLSMPACLFVGVNIFGSGLFTAFSNGLVSGLLSFIRTFVVLTACLYGLTALWSGTGLWLAWPAAEALSLVVTLLTLHHYRGCYEYA